MGDQKTNLFVMQGNLNAPRYINDILRTHAIPFLYNQDPSVTFQHDNARLHTASISRQFPAQNINGVLLWSAVSLDLNLIKHVFDELGRRARANHQINTLQDLQTTLTQEWQALPSALIQQYVNTTANYGGYKNTMRSHSLLSKRCWDHQQAASMKNEVSVQGQLMHHYPVFLMIISVFCALLCMNANVNVCATT